MVFRPDFAAVFVFAQCIDLKMRGTILRAFHCRKIVNPDVFLRYYPA